MRILRASLVVQSLFYVAAGVNHFWRPAFYGHVMPDHYTHPEALVKLSGLAEILGGLGLLLPATRRASAAGIMLMLIVFLDVHWFMLRHPERFAEVPVWALWVRVPLQFVLIAWAWEYTRKSNPAQDPLRTIATAASQDVS